MSPISVKPAIILWCIANGVQTTRQLPEETMFSERECHGHILQLADEDLVAYARSQWWQEGFDGEPFYRRHKRAWLTETGREDVTALEESGWLTPQLLDQYVIGDPDRLHTKQDQSR